MSITDEIRVLTQPVHPTDWTDLDTRAVDTARVLAADAVQKVGNGHPGTAMSLAPLAYTLFQRVMRHDPADADWIGRDRFVLSCGHSSLTLYVQLYLAGYGLELEDLESLRTWGSKTRVTLSTATPAVSRSPPVPSAGSGVGRRHGDGRSSGARPVRSRGGAGREPLRPSHLRRRVRR